METVIIKGKSYKVEIIKSKIKKVYIRYNNDTVIVKTPMRYTFKEVLNVIKNNEDKIYKLIVNYNKKVKFTFENGSEIPFYGKTFKIIYSDNECIRNDYMYLNAQNPLESYYNLARKYGKPFYRIRIDYYIRTYKLNYYVNQIVIRDMKTRYGVCNVRQRKITFQLRLALHNLGYENARNVTIKLKDNDSLTAHLDLALEIYETTGISPNGISPSIAAVGSFSNINLDNYLNGDANCDNVQSMADAASIFQAIGNPDKYSLSDLGQFNADFANDGLTPDDAIAIQKKLAGITE